MLDALDDQAIFASRHTACASRSRPTHTSSGRSSSRAATSASSRSTARSTISRSAARAAFLSLAFILEEGLPIADLERDRLGEARGRDAGVSIVTGDTKVVERGHGDQMFINTTGIGVVPAGVELGSARIRPGDASCCRGRSAITASRSWRTATGSSSDRARERLPPRSSPATRCSEWSGGACDARSDPWRSRAPATRSPTRRRSASRPTRRRSRRPRFGRLRAARARSALVANEGKLVAFVAGGRRPARAVMRDHPFGRNAATSVFHYRAPRHGLLPFGGRRRAVVMLAGEQLPRIG